MPHWRSVLQVVPFVWACLTHTHNISGKFSTCSFSQNFVFNKIPLKISFCNERIRQKSLRKVKIIHEFAKFPMIFWMKEWMFMDDSIEFFYMCGYCRLKLIATAATHPNFQKKFGVLTEAWFPEPCHVKQNTKNRGTWLPNGATLHCIKETIKLKIKAKAKRVLYKGGQEIITYVACSSVESADMWQFHENQKSAPNESKAVPSSQSSPRTEKKKLKNLKSLKSLKNHICIRL